VVVLSSVGLGGALPFLGLDVCPLRWHPRQIMEFITRRAFVIGGGAMLGALAVGSVPFWEAGASLNAEGLSEAVVSLDQRCDRIGAARTFREGRGLFAVLDEFRPYQARTVSRLALTMARAARWSGQDPIPWIDTANDAARQAGDDSCIARCWTERGKVIQDESLVHGVGWSGAVAQGCLVAASVKAGQDADIRAHALYRLGYEYAAAGDRADALDMLTRADNAAEAADWSESGRGVWEGTVLWAMGDLDKAEIALSEGAGGQGSTRHLSFVRLAHVHLAAGEADAALEDVLQADHDTRTVGRRDLLPHLSVLAVKLPPPLRTKALLQISG
jgi:hypothetical protein